MAAGRSLERARFRPKTLRTGEFLNMKMVSKLALAAVLTLGVVATPATAQKRGKDKEEAQPKFELSPAFRKAGAEVEAALKANDWAKAETALVTAEATAKNEDEKYFSAFWRMRVEIHKQNKPGIITAADMLIANPKTPAEHKVEYYFRRGQATFLDGKRQEALPFLLKARELGHNDIEVPFMLAQIYGDANKSPEAVAEMSKAIEAVKKAGRKPEQAWYEWAFARVYKSGDRTASSEWAMRLVHDFPTLANWRRVIVLYRDSVDKAGIGLDKGEKIDLYRLMRGTGALADQNDYYEYTRAALETGLPWETIAVIEEGRKSGKVPQTGGDFARIYTGADSAVKSEGSLESYAKAAKTGRDMSSAADAFLASGNYARALALYDQALTMTGANADAVNLHRGYALVQLGRKDEARTAFELVKGAPLSDIAKMWVTWMGLPTLS
jgi:tetratricopeptide (TPR) repeat protein